MVREIIQRGYGYLWSIDGKTKEVMRIYYIEGATIQKILDKKGNLVPKTKISQDRYDKMIEEEVAPTYIRGDDGNLIPFEFPLPYKNQTWFEKIDEKYLNDANIDQIEAYNIFVGIVAKAVFTYSPDPNTKAIAGIVYAGSEAVTALYTVKRGINALKAKKNRKDLDVARQMERNVRVFENLQRKVKQINEQPIKDKKKKDLEEKRKRLEEEREAYLKERKPIVTMKPPDPYIIDSQLDDIDSRIDSYDSGFASSAIEDDYLRYYY